MIVIYGVILSRVFLLSILPYFHTKRQRGGNRAIETFQKTNRNILKYKMKE